MKFILLDNVLEVLKVLTLVGKLKMEQRAKYIDLFVNESNTNNFHLCVLCATSGIRNVGIDSPDV